jgi:glycosyltransferase involved in cell wall biosynthesis
VILGVDYTAAAWQGAGIGRYSRELIRAAVAQAPERQFKLFYAARGLPPTSPHLHDLQQLCRQNANVRTIPIPLSPRALTVLWQRARLPLPVEWFCGPLDVVFGPDFVLPPSRARSLVTIHDLTFRIGPQWFEAPLRRYLNQVVPRNAHRADHILADSAATRADIVRLLHVPDDRVTVVYPGVGTDFRPLPDSDNEIIRQHLDLPKHFVLTVGTLEPRKNLSRLLEAFALVLAQAGGRPEHIPADLELLIVGRRGWLYADVFATLHRLRLQSRVRILEQLEAGLPQIYNLARVFAYPSLYEGFGLPVLEAMACGTAVVTAEVASLPEISGRVATLVDPHDPAAIAAGIIAALADSNRRRHGPAQARRYSWEAAAHTFLHCCDQQSRKRNE